MTRAARIAVVIAGLALAGCTRRDEVLARVGRETITTRELRAAVVRASREGGGRGAAEIRTTLDALVARALLLQAARDLRGVDRSGPVGTRPADGALIHGDLQERRLLDEVYRIEVLNRVQEPDSAALRREWSRRTSAGEPSMVPDRRSFDELTPDEVARLRGELLEADREARFGALMDSLARAFPQQIDYDRVARLRLPGRADPLLFATGWAFAVLSVGGFGLRLVPRTRGVSPARIRTFGGIALQVGLVGLLFLTGLRYAFRDDRGGWDFDNYHRAAHEMREGMSPYAAETVAKEYWDPATPFLYAPVTLWLFRPFGGLPLERAAVVWLWIMVGAALTLGVISWRLLSGRFPAPLFVAMLLYGFNGALLLALRTRNVSTLETLLLWSAFVAFLHDRRWLSACLIAIAAQFKLLPIFFLLLLVWPKRSPVARTGPILAGLGLFALLLTLPNLLGMPWAHGFLRNLEEARPYGEVNPSALGLLDAVFVHWIQPGGHGRVALALWAAYCIVLLVLSADGLRRAWRRRDPMEGLVITVMLFILLSPRPIVYGYALAIVPTLWIVHRLWPLGPARVIAVTALVLQGVILRGVIREDFITAPIHWFVLVAISNLPFLMALGLWIAFLRAPQSAPVDGSGAAIPTGS